MRITDAKIVSAEDGVALTSHPDAVLQSGQSWTCSCGSTRLALSSLKTSWAGEQPAFAWCAECGDTARWEPIPTTDSSAS